MIHFLSGTRSHKDGRARTAVFYFYIFVDFSALFLLRVFVWVPARTKMGQTTVDDEAGEVLLEAGDC